MKRGRPAPLGATPDETGTNFAVYSSVAERIELCLYDASGEPANRISLPECSDGVWHGYLPGCAPGQQYGYRAHGPFSPEEGLRCNPAQLLIDPYARALAGTFTWHDAVFDYDRHSDSADLQFSFTDSGPFVPKGIVCPNNTIAQFNRPEIPWSETIFYEANVRGYTMRHPEIDAADRGTFDGMRHDAVLRYLKSLGITSLELMPIHAFIDEQHLVNKGLRNFWGYNTISYFAPNARYSKSNAIHEFRDMVRAIHDAGIEVILDVVYNHTGEGDRMGPSLCFRGLDNLAYYSTEPGLPSTYINDTGCGNTLDADSPQVQQLVLESLHYWHKDMGVDGFRFDLAPVLGRHNHGYSAGHPLLQAITTDKGLRDAKLIAEPWDPGPGGYQLGHFPSPWSEWNDRFRDATRRFWRGDDNAAGEFAMRLRGSADLFETSSRSARASINFVSSHDGFTLADAVSYEERHNHANGENNQDGHQHNYSCNYGVEGPSDDTTIQDARRRHRLNLLATLLFSQGTPMLLAGDEFGHSQKGNNNAYAQDNETGWLNWAMLEQDAQFAEQVRDLIRLRRETRLLRLQEYVHGRTETSHGVVEIRWIKSDGAAMSDDDWSNERVFCIVLSEKGTGEKISAVAIFVNASQDNCIFDLPAIEGAANWRLAFCTAAEVNFRERKASLPALTLTLSLLNND